MRAGHWFICTTKCGNGIEYKTKFSVAASALADRGAAKPTKKEAVRAEKLARETSIDLGQTLNCNWCVGEDEHIVFDFSDVGLEKIVRRAGSDERDAVYLAGEAWFGECFVDKTLRRACRKAGVDLRYDWIISDMDGETREPERLHIHMVCSSAVREVAAQVWKLGRVEHKALYSHHHGDLQGLADYMIRQVRGFRGKKRHHPSRNLIKPIRSKPIPARNPNADLAVPRGCEKIYRSEFQAGRPQMLRYWRPPGGRKETDCHGRAAASQ